MLWACARATTPEEFTRKMNEIKDVDEKAYQWLLKKAPTEWSKSHFRESVKCDMLLHNLCESFSAAILPARDKAIVTLEAVKKWVHPVGKRILNLIEKHKHVARHCNTTIASSGKFQVFVQGVETLVVDLVAKKCTCRGFQLTGIPCSHALACIWAFGLDFLDYIEEWYKKDAYIAAYARIIEPMPNLDKWPQTGLNIILPPPEHALPGRPKKKKKREIEVLMNHHVKP
ncbi:uncharacterized protein LOC133806329 [Humulus lupulus]|uniref:uncharacterized protein LOC133806329 n=1 Tax=Humulus lupulus TaxID=3486 RepID=UPI002B40049B|nr:uncharacterized protein LOC133806329 [Humulus lupulus]